MKQTKEKPKSMLHISFIRGKTWNIFFDNRRTYMGSVDLCFDDSEFDELSRKLIFPPSIISCCPFIFCSSVPILMHDERVEINSVVLAFTNDINH